MTANFYVIWPMIQNMPCDPDGTVLWYYLGGLHHYVLFWSIKTQRNMWKKLSCFEWCKVIRSRILACSRTILDGMRWLSCNVLFGPIKTQRNMWTIANCYVTWPNMIHSFSHLEGYPLRLYDELIKLLCFIWTY
jgi:hypothetical protein